MTNDDVQLVLRAVIYDSRHGTWARGSGANSAINAEIKKLIDIGTQRIMLDPMRLHEAIDASNRLSEELQKQSMSFSLSSSSVQAALSRLCPIFPFC